MHLLEIRLSHFGARSGTVINGFEPGLNLIHGPNEAGKTTLLEAVRCGFFGFLTRRSKGSNLYEPADHKGREVGLVVDVLGARWTIVRGEGREGILIRDDHGREVPEVKLNEALHMADRSLYESLFAFSLNELTDFENLDQPGIQDRLLGAALGAGSLSPAAALEHLTAERDRFFSPRAKKAKLLSLRHQYEECRRRLQVLSERPAKYDQLVADLEDAIRQRDELVQSARGLESDEEKARRLLERKKDWEEYQAARFESAALRHAARMPPEALQSLERIRRERQSAESRREEESRKAAELEARLSVLRETHPLDAFMDQFDRITAEKVKLETFPGDIGARERKLEDCRTETEQARESCGPEWTPERARGVPVSPQMKGLLAERLNFLRKAEEEQRRALDALSALRGDLEKTRQESVSTRAELESLEILSAVGPGTEQRLTRLETQFAQVGEEVSRLVEEQESIAREIGSIEPDRDSAESLPSLEDIRVRLLAEKASVKRCDELRILAEEARGRVLKAVSDCGEAFDPAEVMRLSRDPELSEGLTQWREKFVEAAEGLKVMEGSAGALEQQIRDREKHVRGLAADEGEYRALIEGRLDAREKAREFETAENELHVLEAAFRESSLDAGRQASLLEDRRKAENRKLADLGTGWTVEKAQAVATGAAAAQELQSFVRRQRELEGKQQLLLGHRDRLETEAPLRKNEAEGLRKRLEAAGLKREPDAALIQALRNWLDAESRRRVFHDQAAQLEADLDEQKTRLALGEGWGIGFWAAGLGLPTLLFGIGAWLLVRGESAAGGILTGAAVLAAIGFALQAKRSHQRETLLQDVSRRRETSLADRLDAARKGRAEAEAEMGRIAARLPGMSPLDRSIAQERLRTEENIFSEGRETQRDLLALATLEEQIAAAGRELEDLARRQADLEVEGKAARGEWAAACTRKGLPEEIGPDAAPALLVDIRETQWVIDARLEAEEEEARCRERCRNAEQDLLEALRKWHPAEQGAEPGVLSVRKKLEKEKDRFTELGDAQRRLEEMRKDLRRQEEAREIQRERIESLRRDYFAWLVERFYPVEELPAQAQKRLAIIADAARKIGERDRLEQEKAELESRMERLRQEIEGILPAPAGETFSVSRTLARVEARLIDTRKARQSIEHLEQLQAAADQKQAEINRVSAKRDQLAEEIRAEVSKAGFDSLESLRKALPLLGRREILQNDLARLERAEEEQRVREAELERLRAAEEGHVAQRRSELRTFSAQHELPADAPTTILPALLDALDAYRRALVAQMNAEQELDRIASRWKQTLERYRPLLGAAGLADSLQTLGPAEVVARIEIARQRVAERRTRREECRTLEKEYEFNTRKMLETVRQVEHCGTELQTLLQEAGAESEEQFYRWEPDARRLRELLRVRAEKAAVLRAALSGAELEAMESTFSGLAWEEEAEHLQGIAQQRVELDRQIKELDREIGAGEAKRAEWEQSNELYNARQDETAVIAAIETAAEEWLERALAVRLLEAARDRFERERQPEVLQRASDFFRILTGGAYHGVHLRLGERTLYAVRADGTAIPPVHLSRGTVEPLYLALRLAVVAEYALSPQGAPPVLMDDVLVNFDDNRASHAALAIADLARNVQVLLLSCHTRTLRCLDESRIPYKALALMGNLPT